MSKSMRFRPMEREIKHIADRLDRMATRPAIVSADSLNRQQMEAIVAIVEDRWEDLLGMPEVLEAARKCTGAIGTKVV